MWKFCLFPVTILLILWLCLIYVNLYSSSARTASIQSNTFETNHLGSEPNVIKKKIKYHVPKFMLDLYEQSISSDMQGNSTSPDVVKSIIPKNAAYIDYNNFNREYNHLLLFEIPLTNADEEFLNAELKILTIVDIPSNSIGLERLITLSTYHEETKNLSPLEEIHIFLKNNTWLSFNLTIPVKKIISQNNNNALKVVISTKSFISFYHDKESKFKLSLLPIEENFEHDYPILLLTYSSVKREAHRNKRNIDTDSNDETWHGDHKIRRMRNICRKKTLYIDFAEIQYDHWILQPPGYEAYQCQGKCFYPVADHLSPTKHAIVQSLLHSIDSSKVPRTCCVPTKLSSISILYIEDGVLTYRFAYKDMVVAECGCR